MPSRNGSGIALLADPTRLRIVARVAERPCRPSVLARDVGLSPPALSRQLRLLEDGGILVRRRWIVDRRSVLVMIEPQMFRPIIAWLAGTGVRDALSAPGASPDSEGEASEAAGSAADALADA